MRSSHLIHPRPPFSFEQSLGFLGRFALTQDERATVDGAILGAARVDGQTVSFRLAGEGDVDAPILRCAFTAAAPLGPAAVEELVQRLGDWLGVEDDLAPFYALAEDDPPFRDIVRRLWGYHQVRFFTPFENTCWAILSQRTLMAVARNEKHRLAERFGGTVTRDGQTLVAFPEPADLAPVSGQEIAEVIGSTRKANRLLACARAFVATDPDTLRTLPTEALGEWLGGLPGIGTWSTAFILLRGFGRPDAPLPLGGSQAFDRAALGAARAVYGHDLSVEEIQRISEQYGGWRGYWGHYLRAAE
jgi:DNA-3-methyladenine glycosylase II